MNDMRKLMEMVDRVDDEFDLPVRTSIPGSEDGEQEVAQEYWLNTKTMRAYKIPSAFVSPDKMREWERKQYKRLREV